jgi:endonuclease/exonuclease/phosphatase family metal-dependent hydrolase
MRRTFESPAAAGVLRQLDPDILLLQEMKDYDACARLAEGIRPGTYQTAICSAFRQGRGLGKQQVAILAKYPAQAAWAEPWKSMEGIDPPRGFAFAWFKIGGADVGIYCVHLKSNLVRGRDKEAENAKNIRKREIAADQLLAHTHDMIARAIPSVNGFIVGGDFNTNKDQELFAKETSLTKLGGGGGFRSCMEGLPIAERVTHPGSHEYPDATFDYLLGKPDSWKAAHNKIGCLRSFSRDLRDSTFALDRRGNRVQHFPIRETRSASHPRAQRNAFRRRDARPQSRSFARWNQSLRHSPNSNRFC